MQVKLEGGERLANDAGKRRSLYRTVTVVAVLELELGAITAHECAIPR